MGIPRRTLDSLWYELMLDRKSQGTEHTVESDRQKTHSRFHSEYLVNDGALGFDPAWEVEVA